MRSTGRKDRHSKVFTAKGPRDRRVRLSAHTAIQFYDVQDRLGYDRPSKAVDWLIKNAKAAIDELAELPPWNPNTIQTPPLQQDSSLPRKRMQEAEPNFLFNSTNFLPASLESDSIADTIKHFFPVSAPGSGGFHTYTPTQGQDLRLSLQSLQDPILLQHGSSEQQLFNSSTSSSGWPDLNQQATFQWNAPPESAFPAVPLNSMMGHGQIFTQRGPLQSIATPHVRAWPDAAALHAAPPPFAVPAGFSGFRVPARIQGEDEHDGLPRKPSTDSSASRHS